MRTMWTVLGFLILIVAGIGLKYIYFPKMKWRSYAMRFLAGVTLPILFIILMFAWKFRVNTVYAPGYSEQQFMTIKPGMTTQEVMAIVGKPLEVYEFDQDNQVIRFQKYGNEKGYAPQEVVGEPERKVHRILWCYTVRGTPKSDYYERKVFFSGDGHVLEVIMPSYVD